MWRAITSWQTPTLTTLQAQSRCTTVRCEVSWGSNTSDATPNADSVVKFHKEVLEVKDACRVLTEINERVEAFKALENQNGDCGTKIDEILSLQNRVANMHIVNSSDRALVQPLKERILCELIALESGAVLTKV
mmetsp:Transcript_65213/g.135931  ORF Transcript_65213/g.135931 Transcript_65213/m.135931 type:complete len:134 (-) Transcript_65213:48-449(-)